MSRTLRLSKSAKDCVPKEGFQKSLPQQYGDENVLGGEKMIPQSAAQEDGICFVLENRRRYSVIRTTGDPDQEFMISE